MRTPLAASQQTKNKRESTDNSVRSIWVDSIWFDLYMHSNRCFSFFSIPLLLSFNSIHIHMMIDIIDVHMLLYLCVYGTAMCVRKSKSNCKDPYQWLAKKYMKCNYMKPLNQRPNGKIHFLSRKRIWLLFGLLFVYQILNVWLNDGRMPTGN